jgi:hypothetical protein
MARNDAARNYALQPTRATHHPGPRLNSGPRRGAGVKVPLILAHFHIPQLFKRLVTNIYVYCSKFLAGINHEPMGRINRMLHQLAIVVQQHPSGVPSIMKEPSSSALTNNKLKMSPQCPGCLSVLQSGLKTSSDPFVFSQIHHQTPASVVTMKIIADRPLVWRD